VQAVAFSPVGGRLAVATNATLELWNTKTWEREAVLPGDDGKPFPRSLSLSFSGDGAVLAVGSSGYPLGNIALWSMTYLTVVATLNDSPLRSGGVNGVSLSADGSVLAAYTHRGKVELWDIQAMALLGVVDGGPGISLSPDGSLLAMAGQGDVVRVWDVAVGAEVAAIDGHTGVGATVKSVAFSSDGTMLATVHAWEREFYVALWDMPSHRKVGTLVDEGHHIRTLAFSSDGALLATGGDDEVVRLWDVGSSRLVARFKGHRRGINSLSFSPDGSMLASGGRGVVLVWDVASGRLRTGPATGPAVTPSPR
jgi:WD40 repeat protein